MDGVDTDWRSGAIVNPSIAEAGSAIKRKIGSSIVVVAGSCSAEYEGRGSSSSTEGDKLLILKPDGAVIVHGPKGFRPLNWQPSTSHIEISETGGEMLLKFVRRKPRETLLLRCRDVWFVAWIDSPEEGAYWMYLSEEDLREAIVRHPEELLGEKIRFYVKEKRTPAGRADIYGVDGQGRLAIVEVKRIRADERAVRQLEGYVREYSKNAAVRGILAAPDISEKARILLESLGLEFRRIDLKKAYKLVKRSKPKSVLDYLDST